MVPVTACAFDRFFKAWIDQCDRVALSCQVPGHAGADDAGTDNGNRSVQLKASAGITSE
jgi:hypothetical protein